MKKNLKIDMGHHNEDEKYLLLIIIILSIRKSICFRVHYYKTVLIFKFNKSS